MSMEIFWLTAAILLTATMWLPYIINRMQENGILNALRNPKPDEPPKANWANRLMHAHANAVENLVIFSPLVLILHAMGISTQLTIIATALYFWSRVAHVFIYTFGIPYLRTVAFAISFFAQCILVYVIFSH